MRKAFIAALLGFVLALSGLIVINFVYYPRIDKLHQEMQALEKELAALRARLKTLQELYETSTDQPTIYALNGSQISYDLWFTINSTSMLPTLFVGDIVYVQARTRTNDFSVEDIIAFFNPNAWSTITIHRVVERQVTEDGIIFYTQGDNRSARDPWPIPMLNVIGKAVAHRRGDLVDVFGE